MNDHASIETWLESPCLLSGWEQEGTWRDWLKSVLWTLFDEVDGFSGKRPNCDSCWWPEMAISLCLVNPRVANILMYREYLKLKTQDEGEEDVWERIDELDGNLYKGLDRKAADEAFQAVLDHLFAPRLDPADVDIVDGPH